MNDDCNNHSFSAIRGIDRWELKLFKSYLESNDYEESTICTYIASALFFLHRIPKSIDELSSQELKNFIRTDILTQATSKSYQELMIHGIELFYKIVSYKNMDINHPEKSNIRLSSVNFLTKDEMTKIIETPVSIKHRAMLCLMYSAGLRDEELLSLTVQDVDLEHHRILIRPYKGKKRILSLSLETANLLKRYFQTIHPKPKIYLFEGMDLGKPYSRELLDQVLARAVHQCRITKPVTLQWLRNSFAVHLMEEGRNLSLIQTLLGSAR